MITLFQQKNWRHKMRKYVLVLFVLALALSPFSSLGAVYAEGDVDEETESSNRSDSEIINVSESNQENADDEDDAKQSENGVEDDDEEASNKADETPDQESGTEQTNQSDEELIEGDNRSPIQAFATMQADNPPTDGFEWEVNNDGTVTITGYTGNEKDITIPEEIDGKTVTVLGRDSLKNKSLEHIHIPDTVTKIEREALRFNQFTHITLPSSLQELSDIALPGNPLESIEIDDSNQHFKTSADKRGLYTKDGKTLILGTYHGSIEQGTKVIGAHAFFGTRFFEPKVLTEVTIPDSVESIGRYSFAGNRLTEIVIPDSVTEIDGLAFHENNIESVTFSENLVSIGTQAFQKNNLKQISLPNSLKQISRFAFKENELEYVDLPNQLELIGTNAFEDNNITQITIPASVENIYTEAFKNNKINKVTVLSADTEITDTAFDDNQDTAADLRIVSHDPSHAKDLADSKGYTFIQLADLTIIQQPDDFEVAYNTPLNELALPAEIDISYEGETKTVGVSWDNGSPEYNGVTPGQYEFSGELQLEQGMENPANVKASVTVTVSPYAWEDNTDGVTITGYYGNETNLTIPNSLDGKGVTVIGEEAFENKDLETVIIPDTVRKIERRAFSSNNLTSINIPQSVETIGERSFFQNNIEELEVPGTVNEIGANSFGSNAIKTLTIGDGVETISNYAFYDNEITSISIPKSVSSIGRNPFQLKELASITVDGNNDHFKDIDGEGLYTKDGKELVAGTTSGKIVDGTETIRMNAFGGIELTEIVIPESVTSIGREAFIRSNLEKITFKNKDTVINNTALRNYSNIDDLVIYGYTGSTAQAFALGENSYNKALKFAPLEYEWTDDGNEVTITNYVGDETDITIPEEIAGMPVTIIDDQAFNEKDLTSVTLPTNLKEIGNVAFAFNELTEITIPENVKSIMAGPFAGNPLETIEVHKDNAHFKDIDGKGLYTEDGKTLIQGTQAGEIADETINIGLGAFAGVELDTDIHIPDAVESIGDSAFASAETLQIVKINKINKIDIPGSVKEIGDEAFVYVGLTELTLHEGLEKIGSFAFGNNDLTSIEIPISVTAIEKDAFNFNNIDEAIFQTRNVTIDDDIFFDNQDNPADLTIYGYKDSDVESFANDEGYTFIPFPHQLPLDADEPYDFYSGEFIEIINSDGEVVGTIQMPDFDETSTLATARLIVRDVAKDDVTATGLEVAGQIVDIIFVSPEYDYDLDNPNKDEIINNQINELSEKFILSLRINDGATGDIAMYHEDGHGDWDHVGGEISDGFVTATVTDFSKYGVFAESELDPGKPTDPTKPEDPEDPEFDPCESQDPIAAGCPEDQIPGGDDDQGGPKVTVKDDDGEPTKKTGGLLPKTATEMYNYLAVGAILLILGIVASIIIQRRKRATK